jgi:hypothetical protein
MNYVVHFEPAAGCSVKCNFLCHFTSLEDANEFFKMIPKRNEGNGNKFLVTIGQVDEQNDRFLPVANLPETIIGTTTFRRAVALFFAVWHTTNLLPTREDTTPNQNNQLELWQKALDPDY